jgi:hypothetical protein
MRSPSVLGSSALAFVVERRREVALSHDTHRWPIRSLRIVVCCQTQRFFAEVQEGEVTCYQGPSPFRFPLVWCVRDSWPAPCCWLSRPLCGACLCIAGDTAGAETKAEKSSSKPDDRAVVIEMECGAARVVVCVCVNVEVGLEVVDAAAQGSSTTGAACTLSRAVGQREEGGKQTTVRAVRLCVRCGGTLRRLQISRVVCLPRGLCFIPISVFVL